MTEIVTVQLVGPDADASSIFGGILSEPESLGTVALAVWIQRLFG